MLLEGCGIIETKMKILLVNKFNYLYGGAEKHFFDLENLFKKEGHEVIIFSTKDEKNRESIYSKYFVNKIYFSDNESVATNLRNSWRIIYSFEAKEKIRKLIEFYKPDVAHIHNIQKRITPSILPIIKKFNIPVALTLHDYKLICAQYNLISHSEICERCKNNHFSSILSQRCISKSILINFTNFLDMKFQQYSQIYKNNVDLFIAPSQFLRNKFIEFGYSAEKITHLTNFIDTEKYTPYYGFDNYCVYFGRLTKEKGLYALIDAALKIKNINFYIIGTGPEEGNLKSIVDKKGASHIQFLGYLAKNELLSILAKSMFTILPSEWYEVFGLSILESFCLGKPVIASKIGGVSEIIDDGVTGLLFTPRSVDSLADKINYLINNKNKITEMGKNARTKVEKNYNSNIYYEKIMTIYQDLINKKRI